MAQKSNKKLMAETIIRETKREGQRKAKKCTNHRNPRKKKKKKTSLSCGRKLFHPWAFWCCLHVNHEI
jgi:hypothetical protein